MAMLARLAKRIFSACIALAPASSSMCLLSPLGCAWMETFLPAFSVNTSDNNSRFSTSCDKTSCAGANLSW